MGANTNALVIGEAPSLAMGMTYVAMANTISDVMANAVVAEKNMQIIAEAATVICGVLIIKLGVSSKQSSGEKA